MTLKGSDGASATPNITDIPHMTLVAWATDIELVIQQRDAVVAENNALRQRVYELEVQRKAAREALARICSVADVILAALANHRAAIQMLAPNGGWHIETVKAIELAARYVRAVMSQSDKWRDG